MTEETKLNCSVNHNYREGYHQGRADAIAGVDAIIEFIKKHSFDYKFEYDSFKVIGSAVMIDLLEQLKENENE